MNLYLKFVFIFFIGCTLGWIIELFFRRIVHGRWVNPGFLIGPYLPIYGFGLTALTFIYLLFRNVNLNSVIIVILMGIIMTFIELIGGLIGIKNNIKLWDYSDRWCNYKGIICPLFSLIWTLIGALYYFFLASYVMSALDWFGNNLAFSYILGLFTGLILIDTVYSTKLYLKIRKYAKENNVTIIYEHFKMHIKDVQLKAKEKYSFINPFKQTKALLDYLSDYKDYIIDKINKINL